MSSNFQTGRQSQARRIAISMLRFELAKAGISIFPCRNAPGTKGDKSPLGVQSWTAESTADENRIREWFRKYPDALIGIDCGKSGLVVIDCDRHGGPDGVAAFDDLTDANGGIPYGPMTLTQGNGQHHAFRQPDGDPIGCSAGALPKGVDVKAAGGYVIAQGSMRVDGVDGWKPAGSPCPELAEAFAAGTIPVIPQWLADIIRAPKRRDEQPQDTPAGEREALAPAGQRALPSGPTDDARGAAYAAKAFDEEMVLLASTGKGGRNNKLNDVAFRMGTMIARGWIEESTVRDALWNASLTNGYVKDKGPKAAKDTVNSGLRGGKANPHKDLDDREDADDAELLEIGNMLIEGNRRRREAEGRKLAKTPDGTSYDAETGEIVGQKPSDAPSKREPAGAAKEPAIKPTPYEWLDPSSIPPREWLYGYHFIRGFMGVTGASGGVGKSQLTIAEALSMVCGRALLRGIEPVAPLNVWIWNGEDPMHELNRRIAATAKHYGIRREDCRGQLFVNSGRNTKIIIAKAEKSGLTIARPVVDAIKARIKEDKIDVLIIDPFIKSHMVNENDNSAIDAVASEWADVAEHTGCAVELVHHVRKVGDFEVTVEAMRGASALVSAARSARVLNQMAEDESKKAGVDNRRAYFRVNNGKANMSIAPENATWFRIEIRRSSKSRTIRGRQFHRRRD